ncbi:hypothetical protein Srufu_079160 (plasmid) [Streptomyces libani subsp. rufus]|nr:hypothetical protein Srufu_079160 [Streptomyces libani subsp. rufus]
MAWDEDALDGGAGGPECRSFGGEGDDDVVGCVEDGAERVADCSVAERIDGLVVVVLALKGHEAGGVDDDDVGLGAAELTELVDVVLGVDNSEGDGASCLADGIGMFDAGGLRVYRDDRNGPVVLGATKDLCVDRSQVDGVQGLPDAALSVQERGDVGHVRSPITSRGSGTSDGEHHRRSLPGFRCAPQRGVLRP